MEAATRRTIAIRHHERHARWVKDGTRGGLVAGLVFALFEMVVAAGQKGADAFFMPLRMIGAVALGSDTLDPGYSLATAAIVGAIVHMVLAALFGVVFVLTTSAIPAVARSTGRLVMIASIYGLLLWLVNFYAVAPVAGWNWFPDQTDQVAQLVAHTVFFGAVLALYVDRVRRRTIDAPR